LGFPFRGLIPAADVKNSKASSETSIEEVEKKPAAVDAPAPDEEKDS